MERHQLKILLIEDNPGDVRLICEALSMSRNGVEVKQAGTLADGIKALEENQFDAVLLDLSLPDSSGLNTLASLCKHFPNIPILVLTGIDNEEIATKIIETGGQDFLVKGQVDSNILLRSIRYAIDRKCTEDKLRDANTRLNELDRIKNEFIMTVAHELRTPLTIFRAIMSNALANVYGKTSPKLREKLNIADQGVARLGRIISDFLDVSKIEARKMELYPVRLCVQDLIKKTVESLRPVAESKGMAITCFLPKEDLFLSADRDRVVQILTNLIGNALKFVPEIGGKINVNARDTGTDIQVEVEDNGPGIDKPDMEKLFNQFVQIKRQIGPGAHGTGLGLAISKSLVELHRGRIWVESELNHGSRFCFTLPKNHLLN
jgi:signal transduction histidine kinase